MFSTMAKLRASHRLTQDVTATAYLSYGVVEYTYANIPKISLKDSSSLNQFGMGFGLNKTLSDHFNVSGGYDYSYSDRDTDSFGRHVIRATIMGRF